MAAKRFYVVWEGHTPGIYTSWDECQRQTGGYKGAKFKSFGSLEEARQAYEHPETVKTEPKIKKQYYYVVWGGHTPGIYDNWDNALKQITGFKGVKYKTFGSKKLAEKAFYEGPEKYKGDYKKTKDLSDEQLAEIGDPIEISLTVDAACNGAGDFEYKGVWNFNHDDDVFLVGPFKKGSNNIGEFLALVHALAYLNSHKDPKMKEIPIYSDSKIAMGWVKYGQCRTKKSPGPDVLQLIKRAEAWLNTNRFKNPILKWETKVWGEIPADFGRK